MANPELVSNPGFLFEEQIAEFLGDLWRAWRKFSNALPRARRHRDLARHAQLNFHVKFSNIETNCVIPFCRLRRQGEEGERENRAWAHPWSWSFVQHVGPKQEVGTAGARVTPPALPK